MKKLISLLLCLCLTAGVVPALASSADSGEYPVEQMTVVTELLKDILEAAEKANEKEAGVNGAGNMNIIGGVYAVLKRVMAQDIASLGTETQEPEQRPGEKVVDRDTLAAMILELQELPANENITHVQPGSSSSPLNKSNFLMTAVCQTIQESSLLKDAITDSGSRLMEVLSEISSSFKGTVTAGGPENLAFSDEVFASFEEELQKVSDYLTSVDWAGKGKALGLLNLLRGMMEDLKTGMDRYSSGETVVGESSQTIATFLLNDIVEAALVVSEADIETASPGKMNIAGGVFDVAGKILDDINSTRTLASKEEMEALTVQLSEFISGGRPADAEQPSDEGALRKASALLDFAIQTVRESQVISEASEATGANLPDALENIVLVFGDYFAGTEVYSEADREVAFTAYESEAAVLTDYILNHDQHEKGKALGLLNLVHEMIEDIRNTF